MSVTTHLHDDLARLRFSRARFAAHQDRLGAQAVLCCGRGHVVVSLVGDRVHVGRLRLHEVRVVRPPLAINLGMVEWMDTRQQNVVAHKVYAIFRG